MSPEVLFQVASSLALAGCIAPVSSGNTLQIRMAGMRS
jgi:hypothetical protein